MMKQKKVPMRTCVVTKEKYPKKELIRVVRDNLGNVSVDLTGKQNGRGAYLKKDLEVIALARKTKALEKYLEVLVPEEVYEQLENIIGK
ncbi:MAG TPA: YlxR family protein [Candidatus Aphodocola excrementigallinarum]|uniref:YlxR family protein n=1 Tax=Candidatus Aphodocola excrementigallinarum TaxID=2840670 RepID=A0A9D1LGS5_9FIRM|nr:YlxR family protein [Candidatus Aphodocola excrementigallinarum]